MNLGDQLEEVRTNILRDTSDQAYEGLDSRLFSDRALLNYIREAESLFARKALVILDGDTPAITRVQLVTGVKTYRLHKSIFSLQSAKFQDSNVNMSRIGQTALFDVPLQESETFPDTIVTGLLPPGIPLSYYTDQTNVFAGARTQTMTIYPEPSVSENGKLINIRAFRTPITGYGLNDLDRESEIPEDYQIDVLRWVAYRSLSNPDADEGILAAAEVQKQAFLDAIKEAQKDMRRRLFVPVRVSYGRNGFSER